MGVGRGGGEKEDGMRGKKKEGRVGGKGTGERMWRGPESSLPRGPCWLSAGLPVSVLMHTHVGPC